ncbi:class I SAM-dependent methyltransferase [Planctomycetota bacterium]
MKSQVPVLNRLYDDLSWLWPMWGDPAAEYKLYCDHIRGLIQKHSLREARSLLNVGCGGGKNVVNLKRNFEVTGLDLSPAMLDLARRLNPECRFIQNDMRHFSLGESFDCILVDDAIAYITTEEDLRLVFERCFEHLSSGGVMIVGPDETRETFKQNSTSIWHGEPHLAPDGTDVVYVVNNYDPDPSDTTFESAMLFLIRENGKLRIEQDLHITGLFPLDLWGSVISKVGFDVRQDQYIEGNKEYSQFVCVKPT